MPVTTQHELLITSNSVNRSNTDEGVMLGDIMGPGPTSESDLSIAGFLTVGSCLLDLPQPPIAIVVQQLREFIITGKGSR